MKKTIKKTDKKSDNRFSPLSLIVIVIGIIIRFYLASVHHVSGDACWQLSNARFIAENKKLPLFEQFGRDEPFWSPPLFHFVYAFVYIVFNGFGSNIAEFAVKLISPIFGSLALILSYLIAKKLFDKKIAFYSLLFMAVIPLHIDYSAFSYIDGMLTFLVALSVYFALNNNIVSSAIVAGLAILTKYNGIFVLPVLLLIIYKNNRNQKSKRLLTLLSVSLAIGSIWFIRNWYYLGNPVWPFMNSVFHGIEVETFTKTSVGSVNLSSLLNLSAISSVYLGIFGVPDGNIKALGFFSIPYINSLFYLWLLGTLIFISPFMLGFSRLKNKKLLLIWIASYVVLALLYVINSSWSVSRFLLPAFPAVAMIWASGLVKIKPNNFRKAFLLVISLIIIGFVFASVLKINLAANAWKAYEKDFSWAKSSTDKDSTFMTNSQCVSFSINRQTYYPSAGNLDEAD